MNVGEIAAFNYISLWLRNSLAEIKTFINAFEPPHFLNMLQIMIEYLV